MSKDGKTLYGRFELPSILLGLVIFSWTLARGAVGAPLSVSSLPTPVPSSLLSPTPPVISTLIKPHLWKRMLNDREIIVNAALRDVEKEVEKKYSFYGTMVVRSPLARSREILTDYKLYAEMIPYVDRVAFAAATRVLQIEGGIWNFRLKSEILFDQQTDRWIHYRIIAGHFTGLSGDVFFEDLKDKGTVIYFTGEQTGQNWPPRFVIERGAEIVFSLTATRMRSYIESHNKIEKGVSNGANQRQQVPQPRGHL